jgi:hypothetical protein
VASDSNTDVVSSDVGPGDVGSENIAADDVSTSDATQHAGQPLIDLGLNDLANGATGG